MNLAARKIKRLRTVAIIQARMGSTRLPGKVMELIAGKPMLWHVVSRAGRAKQVDEIVVATTVNPEDEAIVSFCKDNEILYYRGHPLDVLDRYYQCACAFSADIIVRITADCPLLDPEVIDRVISHFQAHSCDYASNIDRPTYPDGLDTEVFSFEALSAAWAQATKPSEREHVTPYIRHSGKFRTQNVVNDRASAVGNLRWTVDSVADLQFVRAIYDKIGSKETFGMDDVLSLLQTSPAVVNLNVGAVPNEGYYRSFFRQAHAGAAPKLELKNSLAWQERSSRIIPGGAQTFSKSYRQYVQGVSPVFLERGKGCRVWDVDGNEYIDYVQGLLPNILGYAHDEINAAVQAQCARGHSFSLCHPLEVQLAEKLQQLIPCAEMVRFGKNGSDVTAGAIRAARAYTGREHIACSGYHGWQDWYIGSTSRNAGVPESVRSLTHPFVYNDLASLEKVLNAYPGKFAAIILEPVNFLDPQPGFLQGVKELARSHGAILIFDEICSGFHFGLGGAQKRFGVTPDLATFGKAMANGFPISCVVGRKDVMAVFDEIFFSFTFAGEVSAMAAALKVIEILEKTDALARMEENGRVLKDGFNTIVKEAGLTDRFDCIGHPCWSLMRFRNVQGNDGLLERCLFQQEAVKRGVLTLVTHNLCAAHDRVTIERTLEAYAAVFKTLATWLAEKDPSKRLEGRMIEPIFRVR